MDINLYIKKKYGHIKGYDFNNLKLLHQSIINSTIPTPLEKRHCVGEDFVRCLICEKEMGSTLTSHVKRAHNIPLSVYRMYFGIPMEWTMTPRYLQNKIDISTELQKNGVIGHKESLKKARDAGKKWRESHPQTVKDQALYASKCGDAARKEFFSDPKKFMPNLIKARKKAEQNWKDPKYREMLQSDPKSSLNRFIDMVQKKHKYLMSWRRTCPNCKTIFSPPIEGKLKKTRGLNHFKKNDLFCSRKCLFEAMKGFSFSEWGVEVKRLRNIYKAWRGEVEQ